MRIPLALRSRLLLYALCLPLSLSAADDRQAQWQVAWTSLYDDNRPLKAVAIFESLAEAGWMHTNTLAQFYAITGDLIEAEYLAYAAVSQGMADPPKPIDCNAYQRVPALPAIVNLSRDLRIVMINEGHHVPMHRAFTATVVASLRHHGFTHLGAETFNETVGQRDGSHRAPTIGTGVYSVEPVFGDLVRQAVRGGYTLFPYEQRSDQKSDDQTQAVQRAIREQSQAANIRKVMDETPQARLVIHAGGGHIGKDPDRGVEPPMAYRFMRLTGIEPLSIDQVGGTPSSALKLQSALYRGVERCGIIDFPMVLIDRNGRYLARDGYDATVFFPHTNYSNGRADWLNYLAGRQFLAIKATPENERTLIRAFLAEEPLDAVAMDQMLVPPNAEQVTLALPNGQYRLEREWPDGRTEAIGALTVGESCLPDCDLEPDDGKITVSSDCDVLETGCPDASN